MRLEGRIALGLDEFMLRLGHLNVLVGVLNRTYGNRARIARHLAEALTRAVPVAPAELSDLGRYLVSKKLCVVVNQDGSETPPHFKGRYSHLRVVVDADCRAIAIQNGQGPLSVWFQDLAISSWATRSKVGAVTVDTRETSNKSGVSHLVDWGIISGIANKRLGLTATGRALSVVLQELAARDRTSARNPYVIGHERIVFAFLLFMADGDVLTRLIMKMSKLESLTKTEAMALAVELYKEMRAESVTGLSSVTVGAMRAVRDFEKDLGLSSRTSRPVRRLPSTIWHRMSSRLESLTDIGLVEKIDTKGLSREFEYYYRPTEALRVASQTLKTAIAPSEWVSNHLVETLYPASVTLESISLSAILVRALKLCTGPTGVHIDSFVIVAATLAAVDGLAISLASIRKRLINAALSHPESLRLSRGFSGSRAEFASVILNKADEKNTRLFLD